MANLHYHHFKHTVVSRFKSVIECISVLFYYMDIWVKHLLHGYAYIKKVSHAW